MSKVGNIIILNGTSSSGKTSLARELQSISDDVYLFCSLDAFWDMTPHNIPAGSKNFPHIKRALAKSVRALAETGHNVIVDIVFCGRKTYDELINELAGMTYKIVKVHCPLAMLIKREIARGDRTLGLAESQFDSVHNGVIYDLRLDTHKHSANECAQYILSAL